MNRLEAIKNFAEKRDAEIVRKQTEEAEREKQYKEIILSWHERIQELIETANVCLENGIRFWHNSVNDRDYNHDYFVTDGCSHILGFELNRCNPSRITRIGKEGGGCCKFDVYTDGHTIVAIGEDKLWALERFVNHFDEFESKFYAYVDRICNTNK